MRLAEECIGDYALIESRCAEPLNVQSEKQFRVVDRFRVLDHSDRLEDSGRIR